MSIINCFSANTGLNIDGIVESYYAYAGENISAGDFVEFINVYITHPGQSNYFSQYTPNSISACLIDENKFLIAFIGYQNHSDYGVLRIGTVTSNSITFGVEYLIPNDYVDDYLSMSKLDDNKFILVFKRSYNIKSIACMISGTTINFGTSVTVFTGTGSSVCSESKVVAISTTKAVAICRRGSIYGSVLTVENDLSITVGTTVNISSNNGSYPDICKLTSTKLLITYNDAGVSDGKAVVITVSGTSITAYTSYSFLSTNVVGTSVCALSSNKVFIMFITQTYYVCNGIIANISGTSTITFSNSVVIDNSGNVRNFGYNTCSLSSDKVVLVYSIGTTSSTRRGLIQTALISDNSINLKNTLEFSSQDTDNPFILQVTGNVIILSYDTYYNGTYLQGISKFIDCTLDTPSTDIIDSVETQVRKTTTSQFNGIAKTKGTGGNQVKVYVPDI